MLGKSFIIKRLIANGELKDLKLTMNVSKSTLVNTLDTFDRVLEFFNRINNVLLEHMYWV